MKSEEFKKQRHRSNDAARINVRFADIVRRPYMKHGEALINSARHLSASFPLAPRQQILHIAPLCVRFVSLIERKICTYLTDFILSALPPPISLRPPGLTSWAFIVNFQDICSAAMRYDMLAFLPGFSNGTSQNRAVHMSSRPYMKPGRSVCAFGLTSRGFIVKYR